MINQSLLFHFYIYTNLKTQEMSTKYKATELQQADFITITTVGWVDVFTRLDQKYVIINVLKHCQENK